jgi:hypothetical protein
MDRKRKKANSDNQWNDPLGIEEVKNNKSRTIEIPKDSKNPAHILIASIGVKALIGRIAYCLNKKQEMVSGRIVDVIPPKYIHLKNKGVFTLDDVISIGG